MSDASRGVSIKIFYRVGTHGTMRPVFIFCGRLGEPSLPFCLLGTRGPPLRAQASEPARDPVSPLPSVASHKRMLMGRTRAVPCQLERGKSRFMRSWSRFIWEARCSRRDCRA